MEGAEIVCFCFAQDETLGFDWLGISGLGLVGSGLRGLVWKMCVCHVAVFAVATLWVESKGCGKDQKVFLFYTISQVWATEKARAPKSCCSLTKRFTKMGKPKNYESSADTNTIMNT